MYIDTVNRLFILNREIPQEPDYIEKDDEEFSPPEVPVIKPMKPESPIPETPPLKIR